MTSYENVIIPIEPLDNLNLTHEKLLDWDFFYSTQRMLSSKEIDMIGDKVKVNRLPDMIYGYNRFYIANRKSNFVMEFNPLDMLDLCNFEERNKRWINTMVIQDNKYSAKEDNPNFIYYIPSDVKVQYHEKWKDLKVDREDVKKLDPTEDWTFSSTYMGTISKLSENRIFSLDTFPDFDVLMSNKNVDIKSTDENLPVNRLGQDNPIVKYMEINLYDDELCDNGVAMGNFRYFIIN